MTRRLFALALGTALVLSQAAWPPRSARAADAADAAPTAPTAPTAPAAPAAPAAPTAMDVGIDDIVVTARRARQSRFEADRSVERVTAEEVREQQPRSLPDALRETTGAFVQETNRGGGAPILRGLVGPQNLILIDGLRFNNATFRTGPNQYLSLIDPSSVGSVEVLLGPGSVLYGSDAMGGVIQVHPIGWTPSTGFGGRAGAGFASADLSTSIWGDATWQGSDVHVLLGGAYRDFDVLRAGGGEKQPVSDYQQGAWRARARWEPAEDVALSLTYLAARVRDAGRADRLYEGRFRFYDNDDDFLYLDAEWTPGGVLRELRAAVSVHRTLERADLFRCALGDDPRPGDMVSCLALGVAAHDAWSGGQPIAPLTREQKLTDEVYTPGGLVTADLAFWEDRVRASVGADVYADFVSSRGQQRRGDKDPAWGWKRDERGNFSDGSTYLTFGAFALVEGDVLPTSPHRLVASVGGRVAHFRAHAPDVPSLGDVDYDHTGFAGSASLRYLYERTFMTYASWSQGFRAPNLQESTVLGDTGSKYEVPNDGLGPERSDTIEGGARLNLWPVKLHVAGFYTLLDGVIDERDLEPTEWAALGIDAAAVGDKPVIQRVNRDSGWYAGVEGRVEVGPYHGLTPWAQVAWLRGEIDQGGETVPARRVPPLNGGFGLRYDDPDGRFYVELFSLWAARQDRLHPGDEDDLRICQDPGALGDTFGDSGRSCRGTAAWVTLNLRGGVRIDELLRVDIAATNVTDSRYRTHGSGFDAPGAGVSVSVEGSF